MKITIYELFGLIKEYKAPEKIKYNNKIYVYEPTCRDYQMIIGDDKTAQYLSSYFSNHFIGHLLDKTIEIIEEDEKIECCKNYEDFQELDDYIEHLKEKIDELIDKINNLKKAK